MPKNSDERPVVGVVGLTAAILRRAVRDHERKRYRDDAQEFVSSQWFELLADGCGLDADIIRERIRTCRG